MDIPSATTEKHFSSSFPTINSPGPSTICHLSVDCTLINEYKLLSFVSPDVHRKFSSFLCASFDCNSRELECSQKQNNVDQDKYTPSSLNNHCIQVSSILLRYLHTHHILSSGPDAIHRGIDQVCFSKLHGASTHRSCWSMMVKKEWYIPQYHNCTVFCATVEVLFVPGENQHPQHTERRQGFCGWSGHWC